MMATVDDKFADLHMSPPQLWRWKTVRNFSTYMREYMVSTDMYKPVQTSIINFSSWVNSIIGQELSVCVLTRVAQK